MAVTANGGVLQIVLSVIHTEKLSFLIEFHVKAVAEFHFIPPMLLIDFGDCRLGKSSRSIGLNLCRNKAEDRCGHSLTLAIDLFPISLLVELHFGPVFEPDLETV